MLSFLKRASLALLLAALAFSAPAFAQSAAVINRALIVQEYSETNTWIYAAATAGIANTTTAVTMKAAAGVGIRNVVNSCQIAAATLGGATELAIRDGAAGTVLWRTQLQTTAMPLVNVVFDHPLIGTANTLVEVVTLTAVTGGVYVDCQGNTSTSP